MAFGPGQRQLGGGVPQTELEQAANPHSFKDFNNVFSPGQAHLGGGAGFGLDSSTGQTMSYIGDPMDLFGNRSAYEEQKRAAEQAAFEGEQLGIQRGQFEDVESMYAPYMGMGEQGLAGLGSLMGGEYQPSEQMNYQQGIGEMALSNAYASGGMGRSSAAQTGFGNMYADLLGEDVQRQTGDMFSMVGVGQGALGQIGAAADVFQNNMASIYGSSAAQNAQSALNSGQQQANNWNTVGSGLGGVGQYIASNQGGGNYYNQMQNESGFTNTPSYLVR